MGESSRGLFRGFLFSRKGNKNQVTVRGFGGLSGRGTYGGKESQWATCEADVH